MVRKRDKGKGKDPKPAPATVVTKRAAKRPMGALLAIACLVVAGAAAAYYFGSDRFHAPRYAPGSLKDYNVLLITLDTTRADHLPAYGYKNVKTPGFDRLAETSLIFEDAIAHVPLTLPSHASILTGQLPIGHGVRDNEGFVVDPKIPTLASILKGRGYATGAFVSAFVLDSRWGLNQGFDSYFDRFNPYREVNRDDIQRRAEETESEVEKWLPANKDHRFFCWVHFYDPHEPYDPPEPYASTYASNRYDGEIAYMDQYVGKLLAKLDELRVSDRTLVVVTGDHGEGLGEHDERTHGMFLYSTTLQVPLLIRVPGGKQRRIHGIVRHVDLAPTILDFLGISPGGEMQGSSLIPVINGTEASDRTAYSESLYAEHHYGWSPLRSLTTNRHEFIESPKAELFDRKKDPGQLRNLIHDRESVAQDLAEQLRAVSDQYTRKDLGGPRKMDADTEAKLRSLGYLGSPVPTSAESLRTDPKDKRQVVADVDASVKALARKDFQEALRLALPLTTSDPKIVDAHLVAGSALSNLQQFDKGLDELFKVLAVQPDHTTALATIGTTYESMGKLEEAERWYLKVLKVEKDHPYTIVKLANLYRRMNEPAKAEEYFSRAMQPVDAGVKPTEDASSRARTYSASAEMNFGAGKFVEAERDLKAAIELTPREPDLHFNLAQIYEKTGDVPKAIVSYQQEIAVTPGNFNAHLNLGLLLLQQGNADAAIPCFQKLLQLRPAEPRASFLLAEAYNLMDRNLDEAVQLARQGLAQMPDHKRGYALLAELYTKLGRTKEAAEASAMAATR
jgi:arylsulfatase A-like enzyme/tetratricopeptide (TPR) repeat protein